MEALCSKSIAVEEKDDRFWSHNDVGWNLVSKTLGKLYNLKAYFLVYEIRIILDLEFS